MFKFSIYRKISKALLQLKLDIVYLLFLMFTWLSFKTSKIYTGGSGTEMLTCYGDNNLFIFSWWYERINFLTCWVSNIILPPSKSIKISLDVTSEHKGKSWFILLKSKWNFVQKLSNSSMALTINKYRLKNIFHLANKFQLSKVQISSL